MYRRPLFYLVLFSSFIRLILAYTLELGNDEVYYYTYALHLQSNYFDHPPGIAYLIKLFTANLYFTSEIFVRLGAVFCAAIGTLLSYKIGSFINGSRTGWIAAVLYNTSIYCSIIAGTFILPDSPQIIFWLGSLLLLLVIINKIESQRSVSTKIWILFGLINGLCIMCKVHGIFIWGGLGLYILFYKRRMLSLPGLYFSFLITLGIISPIFFWNYSNHFVTYNYHSARVGTNHFTFDIDSLIQTIFGQWFYNGPINTVITFMGLWVCYKKKLLDNYYIRILVLCGLPMIIVVTLMSMFNSVLPHWSGPGFLTLSFAGAVFIDNLKSRKVVKSLFPAILKCMIGFMLMLILIAIIFVNRFPGTIGNKKGEETLGETDFTLDLYGWRDFGKQFSEYYKREVGAGHLQKDLKIVSNKWFPAAHIDYYVAPLIRSYVVGIGDINDLHHYDWLNKYRGAVMSGEDALCIIPSNYPDDALKIYGRDFTSVLPLTKFVQYRGGVICRYFFIYLLKNYIGHPDGLK